MVRPIWNSRTDLTPFQELLRDYMWKNRIWSQGQLAALIGVTPQAVSNWYHGRVPTPEHVGLIHQGTGIPVRELYRALGWAIPEDAPPPASDLPPGGIAAIRSHWDHMASRIIDDPRIPPAAKEDLLKELAQAQWGYDPWQRRIIAEHTVEGDLAPSTRAATTEEVESAGTAPGTAPVQEESKPRGERHERRAPQRRRATARPRAQPRSSLVDTSESMLARQN